MSENYARIREYNVFDRRRPKTLDYLTRPDLPAIGPNIKVLAHRLEAQGKTKVEIAEALRCNLRDVFRALWGESYLRRFRESRIPREPVRESSADVIRLYLKRGTRSVRRIKEETLISAWYIKKVAREAGYSVVKDRISPRNSQKLGGLSANL